MSSPLPTHHFLVEWSGTRIGFSEVSGLGYEVEVIEYRDGASPEYSAVKMPGQKKFSDVTLKRGICAGDNEFAEWLETISMNTVEKRDVTISLLNNEHEPVVVWKLKEAWPVKIVGPTLDATSNEVGIEELVIAHEGLRIQNG